MDKKSKGIIGLPKDEPLVKPNRFYADSEKLHIIAEYLSGNSTKQEIWEKYTGQKEEHGQLLIWIRRFGYTDKPGFRLNLGTMSKNSNSDKKSNNSFEILQMKNRIDELEKQLKNAEMKAIAFSTMVDIAEKEFNIPIRKKYNTKPSKK